ncbi:hypothetical protein SDC9_105657 [bioreactor metagenome]|uniref:Uncharacterized protein n=1 Tax=bioreactor metagenome TaxID=1076179 RepID=A0A645BAW4_9ZZZZ
MLNIPSALGGDRRGGELEVGFGDIADVFLRELQFVVGSLPVERFNLHAIGLLADIIVVKRGRALGVQVSKHIALNIVQRTHELIEADVAGIDLIDGANDAVDADMHVDIDKRDHEHGKRKNKDKLGANRGIDEPAVDAGEELHGSSSVPALFSR